MRPVACELLVNYKEAFKKKNNKTKQEEGPESLKALAWKESASGGVAVQAKWDFIFPVFSMLAVWNIQL